MHPDSADLSADLDNLKRKVDAGADQVLTQYFFDNALFYRFRDAAVSAGIDIPIIPEFYPSPISRTWSNLVRNAARRFQWLWHSNSKAWMPIRKLDH